MPVDKGGRAGLFANMNVMDVPFNSTNYTAELMRNLQAPRTASTTFAKTW